MVDFELDIDEILILLRSEATSEMLGIKVHQVIGYYEIYPSCNLDVTSSDVEGITTYVFVISECPKETNWGLYNEVSLNGQLIYSNSYLTIEENKESMLGNITTVGVNRSLLTKLNVDMTLMFYITTHPRDSQTAWNKWFYIIN